MDTTQAQTMADPVAEAIARRGQGNGAPMIPQGQPSQQAPSQTQMPASPAKQEFVPTNSHDFVLSTLAEQLKNDHKLEMEKLKMNAPIGGGMKY